MTRRLRKDGSTYFGPYFPANLAHRLVHFIHRHFQVPSCKVDLTRFHPKPCLQFHIHRCLGPCVEGLTTDEAYAAAVRDVRLFLEGRHSDLARELRARMAAASEEMRFEEAAGLRDLIATVEEIEERQKMAAAKGDDVDIFAVYAEPPLVAVNLFHLRNGQIVDRREFFWEDQVEFDEPAVLLVAAQADLPRPAVRPGEIHVPVEFEDREALEELLTEKRGPQGGDPHAAARAEEGAAGAGGDQCQAQFRRALPRAEAVVPRDSGGAAGRAQPAGRAPARIECFDISHIQGTDKVASMVVWEDGRMKKSDYRKFIIRTVVGNDDFASMREVVTRRYARLQEEKPPMPGLVLIDGGLGQLHAAAEALEAIGIIDQPLASIAKREEMIYVYGQEDEPVVLDRFSPILHLIQSIRDEAHRFAVTFHRSLRNTRQLTSELDAIQGVGKKTVQKLLKEFGSLDRVRAATETELATVVGRAAARRVISHYLAVPETPSPAS